MKQIAISLGDPAGIGTETVFRALELIDPEIRIVMFGDWNYTLQTLDRLGIATYVECHRDPTILTRENRASRTFIDVGLSIPEEPLQFGTVTAAYGATALRSIQAALQAVDDGFCTALVTGPIHKGAIRQAGSEFIGHTELLADHCGLTSYARDYAMYFDSPTLKVVLLSVHVPMTEAILRLTSDRITALALLTHQEYANFYGSKPRIAVAGLNPHAGEGGMFGEEEMIIQEGVMRAADLGLSISGPHPPDTIFRSAHLGQYDVVMAMYHDQGLIPVKTLYFEESVNVTLGLPFLRCSVDHGTAFDIAGQGLANARPMAYAIRWAWEHHG